MTDEKFEELVKRLELFSASSPGAYKFRVFLLALLGYAYIFSIVAIMLFLAGIVIWGLVAGTVRVNLLVWKFVAALLVLTGIILRALWVRIEPPDGLELKAEEVKPLFETANSIQRALRAPKTHHVLLTDEFNASVAQVPRLGAFGWHENYLSIGLPLIQALSLDQFRAVIAHEFGHLSGAHGRFSGWVYRIRKTWYQLMLQLEERDHWGSIVFVKFFEWYAPYFAAYSFVLARAQEYEADRLAAEVAGRENMGDALVTLETSVAFLQESYWPSVFEKADNQSEPPSTVYTEMRLALHSGGPLDKAQSTLEYALSVQTTSDDTHPSLSDRLAALGLAPRLTAPARESAAEHLLGDHLENLTGYLNRSWRAAMMERWRERYKYAQDSQRSLLELEKKAETAPLTIEEAWQRAYWTEEFQSSEAALPLYRYVLSLKEDHADALFCVGRIMLGRDQVEGIGHIKRAMQLKGDYTIPGCQVVCSFLVEKGKEEEAKKFYEETIIKARQFL